MTMTEELKPCPWCRAGLTQIVEGTKVWLGMRHGDPVSVSVRHWCPPAAGQPSRMIERIGKDHASAIAAWNNRPESADLALLSLIADIRKAAGDAEGRLMQDELVASIAALRADSERLNYIERTFSGMTCRERYLPVTMIWGKGCNGRTIREACDKYMKRDAN